MYLLSLLLGIAAWLLGAVALWKKGAPLLVFSSFTCCALSLVLELWAARHLALREDASALFDTLPAVALCAVLLVAGTVLLNGLALLRNRRER